MKDEKQMNKGKTQQLQEEAEEEYKLLLQTFNIEDKEPEDYEVKMEAPMLNLLKKYITQTAEAVRKETLEEASEVADKQAKIHNQLKEEIVGDNSYHVWRKEEAEIISSAIKEL